MTRTNTPDQQKETSGFLPKELPVEISAHRSSTRYGLSFQPAPKGVGWALHLKVPRGTSGEKIREILYRHRRWINARFQRFRQGILHSHADHPENSGENHGSLILFDGIFHKILIEKNHPGSNGKRIFTNPDHTLTLQTPGDLTDHEAALAIREFLLSEMIRRTLETLKKRSQQLNLYPKKVVIRNTKRQWGSMNRHGVMSLSLRLAQMTEEILDLVIVHELCHMLHPNHGESFNTLLTRLTPDHRQKMKEMSAIWSFGETPLWETGFSSLPIPAHLLPQPQNPSKT
ncbi:MAG: M48 family metallopeptidase [Leptospirillum sp.]